MIMFILDKCSVFQLKFEDQFMPLHSQLGVQLTLPPQCLQQSATSDVHYCGGIAQALRLRCGGIIVFSGPPIASRSPTTSCGSYDPTNIGPTKRIKS